jgi:hypothetical protein
VTALADPPGAAIAHSGPAGGSGRLRPVMDRRRERGAIRQAARERAVAAFPRRARPSTGLTAAVALPMAYQAHLAREPGAGGRRPPAEVLGTTTVPGRTGRARRGAVLGRGDGSDEPDRPCTEQTLSGEFWLALEL